MTRGMVISKEIDERKMDYRGSKSKEGVFPSLFPFVKEQRADASSYGIKMIYVRCALVTGKPALKRNKNFKIKDTTIA